MRLMKRAAILAGLAAGAALVTASAALAHDDDHGWRRGRHHHLAEESQNRIGGRAGRVQIWRARHEIRVAVRDHEDVTGLQVQR